MYKILARILLGAIAMLATNSAMAEVPDHTIWDQLLQSHVEMLDAKRRSVVDYAGMAEDRDALQRYLDQLASISRREFDSWAIPDQLAMLINAYNAWTVELILQYYPQIESIREIGFLPGAAWRRDLASLFGEQVSLDDIEHDMIRGWPRFQEPRIHFAVNCAAIGCPALLDRAYAGFDLEQQLEKNTQRFLADRQRNFLDGDTLRVSPIFDWYEEDFEQGWQGIGSLTEFLADYADALGLNAQRLNQLRAGQLRIRYSRYDWQLNSLRGHLQRGED